MHDSACRWCIVKKAEILGNYVKHFWILVGVRYSGNYYNDLLQWKKTLKMKSLIKSEVHEL